MIANLQYVTALYAALMGLLAAALTAQVIAGRVKYKVTAGDGGVPAMAQAIRAHANFAEQVPLALLVIGFAEASGAPKILVHGLGIVLVVARLASAFGLSASLGDTPLRRVGASLSIATVIVGSVTILLRLANVI